MHRLHKGDVGQHRLLVQRVRVRQQRHRADGALDGVQQRQAGEHAHGGLLFLVVEGVPARDVVGHRNLLREPKVAGQAIPHFKVLVVRDAIPVNSLHGLFVGLEVTHVIVSHGDHPTPVSNASGDVLGSTQKLRSRDAVTEWVHDINYSHIVANIIS